jgi:Urease accessory protein UreF
MLLPPPTADTISDHGLCRLLTWLSPAFPVGAFSYSHGLEYAVEAELVTSADALRSWIDIVLRQGSGRSDAILLAEAWQAECAGNRQRAVAAAELADCCRTTAELALEGRAQGKAFVDALDAAWAHPRLAAYRAMLAAIQRPPVYPCVVGIAAAIHGIALLPALTGYLQALAANLVSAGVRLIPLGQRAGLAVLAALEPAIHAVASATPSRSLDDVSTSTWMIDWASAAHETQHTRLFRS